MKNIYLLSLLIILLTSCGSNESSSSRVNSNNQKTHEESLDTITSWADLKSDSVIFKAPNGECYVVVADHESLIDEESKFKDSIEAHTASSNKLATNLLVSPKNSACDSEIFDGKDRKAAKISIANSKVEEYKDLDALLATLLDDQEISNKITSSGINSNRVKEEKRNVTIKKTWLYTFKVQSDEDYHLILGSTPDVNTANFFNVEISGLPESNSEHYDKLYTAKEMFYDFFGYDMATCFGKSYTKNFMYKPIAVEVSGSLFFDKLHYEQRGPIGPAWARGDTYWEIHPITSIKFLKKSM